MAKPDDLISLDDDTDEEFKNCQQEYCGNYDSNGLRSGYGCQKWIKGHYEKYEGNFLLDNMHGSGVHVVKVGAKRTICCGKFYCNDLEGYAEIIYTNGIFEGLFRSNRRYGPGVLTYIDGSQDVGLWYDQTLIRLSCVVQPQWIPILGRTAAAKAYLLQFRKLVPVLPETVEDKATQILKSLNASEEVLKNAHQLYNPYIRNRNSTFFNRNLYDEVFFECKDCYIDVALSENDSENNVKKKEDQQYNCTCHIQNDTKREEILKEIAAVDNRLFDLLNIIKTSRLREHGTVLDDIDSIQQIESYNAQIDALMTFKETLRSKLSNETDEDEKPVSTTKILVTELLAWNNEEMYMEMLQYCFLHKGTEKNMSFDVSKLLAGERKQFGKTGKHEQVCIEFLTKCSEGKVYEISDLLRKHNLNPDLCDANGNTGVTFAVARDKILVIKALVNSGANLDAINDEGLTPLTLCMARYLAVQFEITDWQRGFLPEMEEEGEEEVDRYSISEAQRVSFTSKEQNVQYNTPSLTEMENKTRSILSKELFTNLESKNEITVQAQSTSLMDLTRILKVFTMPAGMQEFQMPYQHQPNIEQTYIFNTACVRLMEKPTLQQIQEAGRRKSTILLSNSELSSINENDEVVDEKKVAANKLLVVRRTLLCLLHYGSDPDVGCVPFPALVMAVFTQSADIVEQLLENNADPNVTTLGESMTPLHAVASLQPSRELIDVGEVLLRYNANPNCRASPTHWLLLNASILGHGFENELPDVGKTPLHLLCMRYDFISDRVDYFESLAKLLLQNGANGNDMFLGHSPLSLAVVRGNIRLVQTLLDLGCVDPNQKLGRGMGVPLTVLILKRYADVLYFDVCKVILDTLLEGRANPFEPIFDYGNAIDFMQRKHEARLKAERDQAQKEIKAGVEKKKKMAKNKGTHNNKEEEEDETKGKKRTKATDQVLMQNYLLQRSREVLFKRIQCQATKLLYEFMDEYIPVNDIIELVHYLTPEDVRSSIELLLREGEMFYGDLRFDTLYRLIHFVISVTKPTTLKKKKDFLPSELNTKVDYIQTARKTLEVLRELDISERPKFRGAVHPSTDSDQDKYIVCFYCCRKKGRELYKCPKCEIIYFCSELCNKLCNTSELRHVCGLVFYKSQKLQHQLKTPDLDTKLSQKISMVMSKKSERIALQKKEEKRNQRRRISYKRESIRSRRSSELQKIRRYSFSQRKLEQYVDIMMMHIEKLEGLEEEEEEGSVVSLSEIAKDIAEIATDFNKAVLRQSAKDFKSDVFATTIESQKRWYPEAGASTILKPISDKTSKSTVNRRESVAFSIASVKLINPEKPAKQISSPNKKSKMEPIQVIYQTESSKTIETTDFDALKPNYKKFVAKNKKPEKLFKKQIETLYTTEAVDSEKSSVDTSKQGSITKPDSKKKKKSTSNKEISTSKIPPPPPSSPRKKFTKLLVGPKTPEDKFKKSKDTVVENASYTKEMQKEQSADMEKRKSDEKTVGKKGKFAHYWFQKPFMKRLAKIFPTLDFPKLLLPFACFAEGQLYYRFGKRGAAIYTNYSKL